MKKTIHFNHPETDIPMYAEYDVNGEVVMFDTVDFVAAEDKYGRDKVTYVHEWSMQSNINCYSTDQANNHLAYLGIKERFE